MPVGSQYFHPEGSGRELGMLHCRGDIVGVRVLWTREGHGHADIPTIFDIMCDLVLTLRRCR